MILMKRRILNDIRATGIDVQHNNIQEYVTGAANIFHHEHSLFNYT